MRPVVAIFAISLLPALSWADDAIAPEHGVLMLRNGSIIEGEVLRAGDRYEVGIKDGDLRVRAEDVEFAAATIDECYAYRRQGIAPDSAGDHLSLAEWCLRYQLFSAAGRELCDAIKCDPSHPKIALLERRLIMAIEEKPEPRTAEPGQLGMPTAAELDRLVRGMPEGTVETFTNVIQPMLLNQCSTAACHGNASTTKLKLTRIAANRTQSRRSTQRNLHSVLENIDFQKPDDSPLLTMPIRVHGTSRAAVFTSKQTEQYRQLVRWVYEVASQSPQSKPAEDSPSVEWPLAQTDKPKKLPDADETPDPESPTIAAKYLQEQEAEVRAGLRPGKSAEDEVQPASAEVPVTDEGNGSPKKPARLSRRLMPGQSSARSKPKRGEASKEFIPADEFDAEQFNRQLTP